MPPGDSLNNAVTSSVRLYVGATNGTSTDLQFGFQNWLSGPGVDGQDIYIDNLFLTATSAGREPSVYALLLGLCALGCVAGWKSRAVAAV